jgi:hypothetical protein
MKKLFSLVLCILLGTSVLTGCSVNDEPYTEKNYTAENEQIMDVCIDVRDRFVEVTPSTDGKIHINYYDNSKETYDISVSDENVLTMTAVSNKEWMDYIGDQASEDIRKISVQLPNELLYNLSISTTNENIAVTALKLNEKISLNANGGNISFDKMAAGKEIVLDVKNGNISGVISGSYDDYAINCNIKKGESNLPANKEDGSKKLIVNANNGDVKVDIK